MTRVGLRPGAVVAALVLAAALWLARPAASPAHPADAAGPPAPSLLLVTIDTLRADHVGAYGDATARTPNLDALAARGVRFDDAISQSIITGPSHATILTGRRAESHGVMANGERLRAGVPTLPEALAARGYDTAAFVSGWTTRDVSCGLPSRFAHFDDDFRRRGRLRRALDPWPGGTALARRIEDWRRGGHEPLERDARATTDLAEAWLAQPHPAPFLLWVHYFDPHLPYLPPPEYVPAGVASGRVSGRWYPLDFAAREALVSDAGAVADMKALYDAEIAFADAQLGRLLAAAERAAGPGGLLVVATSDHGESMGEHRIWWNRDVYAASVHVPLIFAGPAGLVPAGRHVAAPVRLMDVAPTLLALLDAPPLPGTEGASLVAQLRGESEASPGPAWSSHYEHPEMDNRSRFALRTAERTRILRVPGFEGPRHYGETHELYDRRADPGERRDLAGSEPALEQAMDAEIRPQIDRARTHESPALSEGERERLRALGYLP